MKRCPLCDKTYENKVSFCTDCGEKLTFFKSKFNIKEYLIGKQIDNKYKILFLKSESPIYFVFKVENHQPNLVVKVLNPNLNNDHNTVLAFLNSSD